MQLALSTLIRQAAQASAKADHVYICHHKANAPGEMMALAAENSLQAGTLLNKVILSYLKAL